MRNEGHQQRFYRSFFLVAQRLLPRHQVRMLIKTVKEERKMLDEKEKLSAAEAAIILRPVLDELVKKHGVEKANEILKEAARRLGFNPDEWSITVSSPS